MKPYRGKKGFLFLALPFLALVFSYSLAFAATTTYPADGWRTSTPEKQGLRSQMLAGMLEDIQTNHYSIDSVSIIRNGYMVLDAYFYPFSKGLRHNIYSCTKSIMSILVGIAIDKGFIKSIHQPVIDFFPDKKIGNLDDKKKSITIEDLLKMASGLACRDSYLYQWKGLFEMKGSDDWVQHVLSLPMDSSPGEKFEYCNGVSHILSAIISKTTKMKTIDFAKKYLFGPLGISEFFWETSPQGIDVGYGKMWLKPHDMAKIGWLYINKGKWGQKHIVSQAWVKTSTQRHIKSRPNLYYGYHWWLSDIGMYAAVGYHGQYILVADKLNMVIVFTGNLSGKSLFIPLELTKKYIIPAATSSKALPENEKEAKRLDSLVKSVSKTSSHDFVWLSKEEGTAKDGVFKRTKSPKFMFEYPIGSKKQSTSSLAQVMRMKTPEGVFFAANITTKPEGVELKDFGPIYYARILRQLGSDVKVVGNKEIVLKCGTKAYRTDIKWVYRGLYQLKTVVVSSYKDGRCIYVDVHPAVGHEEFAEIAESLTFEQAK